MTERTATLRKFHCSGSEYIRHSDRPRDIDPEFAYSVRHFREHSAIVVGADDKEAAEAFRKLTGGVSPNFINGREVVGFCEACEIPLFEGDPHDSDGEGVKLCRACYPAD